ncbi:unnamed protein product [Hymenolepis diminuta]|uniref:TPR_REGION domain-containing protein n=1 Tax=Hymenolepis diminuta TaxID=6216 RepID=A0A0R3SPP0_HYMDI|nr:unnamed protein product [Hymenolepis diminuta]VUZ48960.1 unnamed protein product [Hymenolepis diminuta]
MTRPPSKTSKVKVVGSRALGVENLSPHEILKKADEYWENLNSNKALKLYEKVIANVAILPSTDDNMSVMIDALQSSASILAQEGRIDEAIAHFKRAIEISPNSGYEKYMSLAQLSEGDEAVNLYQMGIKIISDTLKTLTSENLTELQKLNRDLSIAHCAIAEVYMVDLSDDPSNTAIVQQQIDKAIEVDECNPQAWYVNASNLFLTGRHDEAKGSIEKCLSLYWPEIERIFNEKMEGEDVNVEEGDDKLAADLEELSGMPPEKHFEMVLMLSELQMHEQAEKILILLSEIDDTNPDVMFQLALVARTVHGESDPQLVRHYVKGALEVCAQDPEMVSDLTDILSALPAESEGEEDGDDTDDGDLETDSDELDEEEYMEIE